MKPLKTFTLIALLVFCSVTAIAQQNTATVFNLSDFDAAGDGVTDDGPALQRALDAVAEAGGGTLIVPAGLYLIKTPVVKDFGGLNGVRVHIQGVPSNTMPAPPNALGHELAASLDLASEFLPATGSSESAITIRNLDEFIMEHLAFTGNETTFTDAFITVFLSDINHATIRHSEFYGISTFGVVDGMGGGNVVRAMRSELSIESTVFLGCAANSGTYAPIVQNMEWKKFSISNSIFIDYGLRSFFGKMGLGAPLSWINLGVVAAKTPESPYREAVIRDSFFDEGGWIGITAFPHFAPWPFESIDLVYISGLKMNVSNLATAGHQFFDVRNVLIENSHYGWSKNSSGALDINRSSHVILDRLTCIEKADRIRADSSTQRLTVINSVYGEIISQAQTTTEMTTAPEDDPVQYVRQQFLSSLARQPDPAAHFYWSDLLIRCGTDNACLNEQRAALGDYLESNPQPNFSITGTVADENGDPLSGARIVLSGSQSTVALTDALGNFRFTNLPTTGTYTVTANKRHYSFDRNTQTFVRAAGDVQVDFSATLNRHKISGRISKHDGTAVAGVTVHLIHLETQTVATDTNGAFSFADLPAGRNYTIVPVVKDFMAFAPVTTMVSDLDADRTANFAARLRPELLTVANTDLAAALDSVSFVMEPLRVFHPLDFSIDGLARLIVFATNLEHVNSPSQLTLTADDSEQGVYPLEVEYVGDVPGQRWLKQINIRLSPSLGEGTCFRLRVSTADLQSDPPRVCFAVQKSGS